MDHVRILGDTMITKVQPDNQRAASLKDGARITLERLKETTIEKYPSNTLVDYYDSVHKLLEAFALVHGIKIKGDGAHQELIEYASKEIPFDESTRIFLQQLREYRNRISYEGFTIGLDYIEKNQKRILEIIRKLS